MPDTGNLMGTTRTLDGALGDKTKEPIEPGLLSRDGWTVVDDSARPLFDSADFSFVNGENSPWPWVMQRPAGDRQDWYFFGYGHDYKQALGDYTLIAGRIPLPPRFAFGAWWSRYWAYSDQELDDLVRGFRENDVPLDVLVIDMDWHLTFGPSGAGEKPKDQSGHTMGWSGYTWNKLLFPDPEQFLKHIHEEGLKVTLNLHPASGVQPWEDAYPAMARAMGIDPATKKYVPFDITNKKFATNYLDLLHHPLEKQGIDFWWLDWQQEDEHENAGCESDVVAQLRSLLRPGPRGQAASALPSLGRLGQSSLPDWFFGRHDFGVGVAGVSALVHGDCSQRRLRLLESRHRWTHAGRGRA